MYGCRPRPQDLDLHPTEGPKHKKERYQGVKKAKVAHGIATNIDISTQAWYGAHKHIDLSIGM